MILKSSSAPIDVWLINGDGVTEDKSPAGDVKMEMDDGLHQTGRPVYRTCLGHVSSLGCSIGDYSCLMLIYCNATALK